MATSHSRTKKPRKTAKSKSRQMPWRTSEAIGVGFFVLAVAMLAALISSRPFTDLMQQALGQGAYLVPALFAGLGVILARSLFDRTDEWRWREIVGAMLLFAVAVALMHLVVSSRKANEGGGWLGTVVVDNLRELAGPWPLALGLVFLGTVSVFLALSLPPRLAWRTALLLAVATGKGLRFTVASVVEVLTAAFNAAKPAPAAARTPTAPASRAPTIVSRTLPPPPVVRPIVVNGPIQTTSTKPAEAKKPEAAQQTPPPAPAAAPVAPGKWVLPQIGLLEKPEKQGNISEADVREKVGTIEGTLSEFNIDARVVEVNPGPVITQFGIEPGFHERRDRLGNVTRRERVKVAEITALKDDLALALAARAIRIEAPVPGRSVIGIEVPNGTPSVVNLRNCMDSDAFRRLSTKCKLAVALGQDVLGDVVCADVAKTPHLLIAGATGAGKSVCINALISCLLMQNTPEELKLILIDPKRVELTVFNDIPHLLRPVVVEIDRVISVLQWATHEMDTRHKRFELFGVRNIDGYNKKIGKGGPALPYIVVIIDELADVMAMAPDEVEGVICRLAQMARATGIHLVLATQRPSVDVITGLIKANFPSRISFAVVSQVDSRTILDHAGAEKLLGRGDMLFKAADAGSPVRLQGTYVSDAEIERIVGHWRKQGVGQYVQELVEAPAWSPKDEKTDDLYEQAVKLSRHHHGRVSTSLLQRRLRVGYPRAARLMEEMQENGAFDRIEAGEPPEGNGTEEPAGEAKGA